MLDVLVGAFDGAVRHASQNGPAPRFALVSALAEGADQMAADAALARGFTLIAPLPFAIDEYAKDFADDGPQQMFREFVARSDHVVELPGTRDDPGASYEAVGREVIARCDVLVVIWDGGASAGRGGTTEMIYAAASRGVPTVHIDAHAENETRLLRPEPGITPADHADLKNLSTQALEDGMEAIVVDVIDHRAGAG